MSIIQHSNNLDNILDRLENRQIDKFRAYLDICWELRKIHNTTKNTTAIIAEAKRLVAVHSVTIDQANSQDALDQVIDSLNESIRLNSLAS